MTLHPEIEPGPNDGPSFFHSPVPLFLFFGGKGGVGKTTCAAAAALKLAHSAPENTFLLISTDPAHSLVDSLADLALPANLHVLELNAQQCLEEFKAKHRDKLYAIAARGTFFDNTDLDRLLDLSLPGLDEIMALIEISAWIDSGRYATVIIDTAPTGHTLSLLGMPEVIQTWIRALDALLAKHRFMRQRFQKNPTHDELDIFLLNMHASINRVKALLRDHRRCCFVSVMLAEELSILETMRFLIELSRQKIRSTDIVVNRLIPTHDCPVCADARRRQQQALTTCYLQLTSIGYSMFGTLLRAEEVRGAPLETFWENVTRLEEPRTPALRDMRPLSPHVESPPTLPSAETRLLIFAGKGGVGKTTMACATATRLACEYPDREILLFSTDPAHSIADCLVLPVGPKAVRLAPGLLAMEIDAEAAFVSLKGTYQHEIKEVFSNLLKQFDIPFDRQVVEQMLDVSPPGLSEIMALTTAMDYLDSDDRRILILDAAPTGHLIRLLELPRIIEDWLQTFFDILLKYDLAMRLPKFSRRLVHMSKNLKRLRALWEDPRKAAIYTVAIPTEMAFLETRDLVAASARIGLNAPVLILNLATAPSECPLCLAVHRRESAIEDQFQRAFPDMHQTLAYRRGEPRGLESLTALGQALYQPTGGPCDNSSSM
ncbi:MAG: ArsA family ATPase [Solidesulfovibrio sp.]